MEPGDIKLTVSCEKWEVNQQEKIPVRKREVEIAMGLPAWRFNPVLGGQVRPGLGDEV